MKFTTPVQYRVHYPSAAKTSHSAAAEELGHGGKIGMYSSALWFEEVSEPNDEEDHGDGYGGIDHP